MDIRWQYTVVQSTMIKVCYNVLSSLYMLLISSLPSRLYARSSYVAPRYSKRHVPTSTQQGLTRHIVARQSVLWLLQTFATPSPSHEDCHVSSFAKYLVLHLEPAPLCPLPLSNNIPARDDVSLSANHRLATLHPRHHIDMICRNELSTDCFQGEPVELCGHSVDVTKVRCARASTQHMYFR